MSMASNAVAKRSAAGGTIAASVKSGLVVGAVACMALAAAGCSTDFARIDGGRSLGHNETGAIPTPPEPIGRNSRMEVGASAPTAEYSPPKRWRDEAASDRRSRIDAAALPEVPAAVPPQRSLERSLPARPARENRGAPATAPTARVAAATAGPGGTVTVVAGDTLYALSKRHGITLDALMRVNGLATPTIKPGQRLVLPGDGVSSPAPAARVRKTDPIAPPTLAPAPTTAGRGTVPVADDAPVGPGRYRVKPGDSLYSIARRHGVDHRVLQEANAITDPTKVRPGVVLDIPAKGSKAAARAANGRTARLEPTATSPAAPAAPVGGETVPPSAKRATKPLNTGEGQVRPGVRPLDGSRRSAVAPDKSAAIEPARTNTNTNVPATKALERSEPPAKSNPTQAKATTKSASGARFRWPVRGKIVAEFGRRADGTHNDGINISVPVGSTVHAVDEGEVTYADDKLRSYGNLVVIRHPSGLVTAYAHNETMLVKRGDKVRRGQPIAKVGKSGDVAEPQLHFEVRQGATPVDPMPYMERL